MILSVWKIWAFLNLQRDDFESMEDMGVLEFTNFSLDKLELEFVFFNANANENI